MMKLYTMTRPSMLPTACAPSISMPATASAALLAAKWTPAPRVHQVQVQAELARVLVLVDGNEGTTGFQGNETIGRKRYTDGGSGVPPRGRPV